MLEPLLYPPVQKALLALFITAVAFPIPGIYTLRMNLLPFRFMLMHGVFLGGVLFMGLGEVVPFELIAAGVVFLLLLLLWGLVHLTKNQEAGQMTLLLMIVSMGLTLLFTYRLRVPAREMLALLWGSPYALSWGEVGGLLAWSIFLLITHLFWHLRLSAFFFDPEISHSLGISRGAASAWVIFTVAVTVILSLRLMGAFLLDTILLIPPIIAGSLAKSFKGLFWTSSFVSLFTVGLGAPLAIHFDLPLTSAIALVSFSLFIGITLTKTLLILKIEKR